MDDVLVRLRCGATGIYIGYDHGLFVSAQDNDLSIDRVDKDRPPQEGLPLPLNDEVSLVRMGFQAGFEAARPQS